MTKFNTPTKARAPRGRGFIESNDKQPQAVVNPQGGTGYLRNEKSELFLLAVSNFVGESTFYEGANDRDARFAALVAKVAVKDVEWLRNFVAWLRNDANMRSASLVAALEGADALNKAGIPGGRGLVAAALARADEPGEALAYWFSHKGRVVPKAVKRGIADSVERLYTEYSLAKYDSASKGFRFGDVIDLVHPNSGSKVLPSEDNLKTDALYKYALDRRRDAKVSVPANLGLLRNRAALLAKSPGDIRALVESGDAAGILKDAGLTWEALSGIISGGMDKAAWEAVIPSMGYMALLRNLRNFEQAGVSDTVLDSIAKRLADPEQVARSRQLPMRFLSAYQATKESLRFGYPLEKALQASLANVPSLKGKTLILVDRSGSMFWTYSDKSDLDYANTAAVFGSALALRAEDATLVEFGTNSRVISFNRGDSVLKTLDKFTSLGGTNTAQAVAEHFKGHDRVIILTDEQVSYYGSDPTSQVPANVPVYTWNLAGYRASHGKASANRVYFGGLSDQSFGVIPLLEAGKSAQWPWEN